MYCITEYIHYIQGTDLEHQSSELVRTGTSTICSRVVEYEIETAALIKVPDGPAARYKGNAKYTSFDLWVINFVL